MGTKLSVKRETVRLLAEEQAAAVVGGTASRDIACVATFGVCLVSKAVCTKVTTV